MATVIPKTRNQTRRLLEIFRDRDRGGQRIQIYGRNDSSGGYGAAAAVSHSVSALQGLHYLTDRAESDLTSEVNLGALASGLLYGTVGGGISTISSKILSAFIETLLDDANSATARATLGLIIGTNVQAVLFVRTGVILSPATGNDVIQYVATAAGDSAFIAENPSTTADSGGVVGTGSGATGATFGVKGISGSSDNAAYGGRFTRGGSTNAAGLFEGPLDLTEVTAPSNPPSGQGRLYAKTDNSLHYLDDAGTDTNLTAAAAGYTDEQAQDAVGAMIVDTATIDLTYTDATPELKADVKDGSITYAKMQDVSATDKLLGRSTAGSGDVEEIACTAAGRAILDDANAAAQLVTLGAQPLDATLTALAGAITAADLFPYFTGVDTVAVAAVTAAARGLLDDASVAAMLVTLGAGPPHTSAIQPATPKISNTAATLGSTDVGVVQYCCKAPKAVAAGGSITMTFIVTQAWVTAGTTPWCEVAILTGAVPTVGNPSLAYIGSVAVASAAGTGVKTYTIVTTNALAAGDDLWIGWGSKATTTRHVFRAVGSDEWGYGIIATKTTMATFSGASYPVTFNADATANTGAACIVRLI